ncbi:hypothetical protein fugu_008313 [Takifugu bimaculatus]|uniref:PH domain-containing protein n=1 Tax=Takifugu bimaculatus TaxID=433685 RepID=A0A4Z2B112_9TELE|nr:hypothetical protein fugu_008313 [Takifugu bimaculatus]
MRRGMDSLLISEPKKTTEDLEEVGMTIDDYVILADIPKIQLESEEELPGLRWRNQSPSPCRDQKLRTYRYQEELDTYRSRFESEERGRGRERGRDRREKYRESENGLWSGRESASSRHAPSSDNQGGTHGASRLEERGAPDQRQTQGWMSRLDEHGKWRKHWFVLCDTWLRFYRDSDAEELDDLDGEIDLASCVNVSECDVEKNYGVQIQDSGCEPATCTATNPHQADPLGTAVGGSEGRVCPTSHREEGEGWDREQAKRLEERNRWFEKGVPIREMGSRWDSMELKSGSVPVPVIDPVDSEVSMKWTELERLSFRDMSAQSLIGAQVYRPSTLQQSPSHVGSQTSLSSQEVRVSEPDKSTMQGDVFPKHGTQAVQTSTAETSEMEHISQDLPLRNIMKSVKSESTAMVTMMDSPCGPGAPCRAKLEAMEIAHRRALQELQEEHERELRELEEEKTGSCRWRSGQRNRRWRR